MSRCEQYQEWISRMVDGDLSAAEELELREHVQTCPECAMLYKAFSALSDEMQSDLEEVPLDLRESVMAEVRREEIRRRNRIPNILRGVMSAAACVAVIVGVYLGVSLTKGDGRLISAVSQNGDSIQASKAMGLPEAAPAALQEEMEPAAMLPQTELPAEQQLERPAIAEDPMAAERADMASMAGATANALPETAADEALAGESPEAAEEAAGEAEAAEEPEESAGEPVPVGEDWELSGWDLSLLRQLLKGSPSEMPEEELQDFVLGRIHLENPTESYVVELYDRDGVLYYRDPIEETIYRAELTAEELRAFFGA